MTTGGRMVLALAPLAVDPPLQRQGVGLALSVCIILEAGSRDPP
ncbi:hypothetical protein [Methanoculleus sp.]|jgi:predicted N-acetyltransferase YhbS|nr:hypothetical protein [Methanoculleus sp.]